MTSSGSGWAVGSRAASGGCRAIRPSHFAVPSRQTAALPTGVERPVRCAARRSLLLRLARTLRRLAMNSLPFVGVPDKNLNPIGDRLRKKRLRIDRRVIKDWRCGDQPRHRSRKSHDRIEPVANVATVFLRDVDNLHERGVVEERRGIEFGVLRHVDPEPGLEELPKLTPRPEIESGKVGEGEPDSSGVGFFDLKHQNDLMILAELRIVRTDVVVAHAQGAYTFPRQSSRGLAVFLTLSGMD